MSAGASSLLEKRFFTALEQIGAKQDEEDEKMRQFLCRSNLKAGDSCEIQELNQRETAKRRAKHAATHLGEMVGEEYFTPEFQAVTYRVQEVRSVGSGKIAIINKDGEKNRFIWQTKAKNVQAAVRHGIIFPGSFTGNMIATLGRYHSTQNHDRALAGVYDESKDVKLVVLNLMQDLIASLQGLERLINTAATGRQVDAAITACEAEIRRVFEAATRGDVTEITARVPEFTELLNKMQTEMLAKTASLRTRLNEAHTIRGMVNLDDPLAHQFKEFLSASDNGHGIHGFLRNTTAFILYNAESLNRDVVIGKGISLLPGKLNNFIQEAKHLGKEYRFDLHNPMSPEHQGHFGDGDPDQMVVVDSTHHWDNSAALERAVVEIGVIEALALPTLDRPTVSFISPRWRLVGDDLANSVKGMSNTVVRALGSLVLPERYYKRGECEYTALSTSDEAATFREHQEAVRMPLNSVAEGVYRAGKNVTTQVAGAGAGVLDLAVRTPVETRRGAQRDWLEVTTSVPTSAEILGLIDQLQQNPMKQAAPSAGAAATTPDEASAATGRAEAKSTVNPILTASAEPSETLPLAVPPYKLTTYNPRDLLNVATHGGSAFLGYFLEHIYAKQHFTSLIFTVFYAYGGFAAVNPELLTKLLTPMMGGEAAAECVGMTQQFADYLAHGTTSQLFAAGFTLGKMASAPLELLLHGRESWLVQAAKDFAEQPAHISVAIVAAVALGWAVAHGYPEIPWLSEHFREDFGTFWPMAAGFAAAKILVVTVHLFTAPEADQRAEKELELAQLVEKQYRKGLINPNKELDADDRREIARRLGQARLDALGHLYLAAYQAAATADCDRFEKNILNEMNVLYLEYLNEHPHSTPDNSAVTKAKEAFINSLQATEAPAKRAPSTEEMIEQKVLLSLAEHAAEIGRLPRDEKFKIERWLRARLDRRVEEASRQWVAAAGNKVEGVGPGRAQAAAEKAEAAAKTEFKAFMGVLYPEVKHAPVRESTNVLVRGTSRTLRAAWNKCKRSIYKEEVTSDSKDSNPAWRELQEHFPEDLSRLTEAVAHPMLFLSRGATVSTEVLLGIACDSVHLLVTKLSMAAHGFTCGAIPKVHGPDVQATFMAKVAQLDLWIEDFCKNRLLIDEGRAYATHAALQVIVAELVELTQRVSPSAASAAAPTAVGGGVIESKSDAVAVATQNAAMTLFNAAGKGGSRTPASSGEFEV